MTHNLAENINTLSNYLSEAVYEVLTVQDSLEKYQKLINRYAEKAELDLETFNTDLNDFMELFQEAAADFTITSFEEKSLIAQGKLAYIKEETIQKLIHFVKTATKKEEKLTKYEVRMPSIDGQKEQGTLLSYSKADQDFIQKEDVLCFIKVQEKRLTLKSPISGKVLHKKGVGDKLPFGGTICEISDEKRNGHFEYTWQDGVKYIGDFLEEEPSGTGKFIYPNGDTYVGDVLEGKKNGFGKMTFANGDIYEGDWLADSMQGKGTFIIRSLEGFVLFESRKMYKGKATYNLPNGDTALAYFNKGKRQVAFDGTTLIKDGTPKNDKVSHIKFKNGDIYYGEFENGLFQGKGFYHYAKKNCPDFRGVKITYYKANFVKGQPQGEIELNFDQKLFNETDFITQAIDGKILAFEFPLLCLYEGNIENGEGKVYTSQYNLFYIIRKRKEKLEKLREEIADLEKELLNLEAIKKIDPDSENKIKSKHESTKKQLTEVKQKIKDIETKPQYFDLEKEREKAKNKSEEELEYFNPLELDLLTFEKDSIKSDDPDERKYYGVLEGNFKNFESQGIATYSNYYFAYSGEFNHRKLQGKGSLRQGNRKWEGHFENNHLLFGKAYENNKLIYEGEFEKFYLNDDFMNNPLALNVGEYSGKGKLTFGEEFWEGEFSEGKFEKGQARQKFNVKIPFYSNHLQEGILEGKVEDNTGIKEGKFTCINGNTLSGTLFNGEFIRGKVKLKDLEYDGEIKDGKAHGKGNFRHNDGYAYEGNWKKGMREGFGKETRPDKSYYEGEWKQNEQHGEGKWIKSNGEVYEGQFENGRKNGFGKLKMNNGDEFEGVFKAGLFNGEGSLQSTNGDRYEGQWKAGKRHGEGIQILANENKTLTGLWEEDEFVKDYNKKNLWQKMFGK